MMSTLRGAKSLPSLSLLVPWSSGRYNNTVKKRVDSVTDLSRCSSIISLNSDLSSPDNPQTLVRSAKVLPVHSPSSLKKKLSPSKTENKNVFFQQISTPTGREQCQRDHSSADHGRGHVKKLILLFESGLKPEAHKENINDVEPKGKNSATPKRKPFWPKSVSGSFKKRIMGRKNSTDYDAATSTADGTMTDNSDVPGAVYHANVNNPTSPVYIGGTHHHHHPPAPNHENDYEVVEIPEMKSPTMTMYETSV